MSGSYKNGIDFGNKAFEAGSDEDLLGSNFDRISRVLPNHEHINRQLPDFNEESSNPNNQSYQTDSKKEHKV